MNSLWWLEIYLVACLYEIFILVHMYHVYVPSQHKDNSPSSKILLLANTSITLSVEKMTSPLALGYIVHVISIIVHVCAAHLSYILNMLNMKRSPHGNTQKYDGQVNFLRGNFISDVACPRGNCLQIFIWNPAMLVEAKYLVQVNTDANCCHTVPKPPCTVNRTKALVLRYTV